MSATSEQLEQLKTAFCHDACQYGLIDNWAKMNPISFDIATQKKWLNDIIDYSLQNPAIVRFEDVVRVAQRFDSEEKWKAADPQGYNVAIRLHWDIATRHRHQHPSKRDAALRAVSEEIASLEMRALNGGNQISKKDFIKVVKEWVFDTAGRSLGSASRGVSEKVFLTPQETIFLDASRHKSLSDWRINAPETYYLANDMGLLEKALPMIGKSIKKASNKEVGRDASLLLKYAEIAERYTSLTQWSSSADRFEYYRARRKRALPFCLSRMQNNLPEHIKSSFNEAVAREYIQKLNKLTCHLSALGMSNRPMKDALDILRGNEVLNDQDILHMERVALNDNTSLYKLSEESISITSLPELSIINSVVNVAYEACHNNKRKFPGMTTDDYFYKALEFGFSNSSLDVDFEVIEDMLSRAKTLSDVKEAIVSALPDYLSRHAIVLSERMDGDKMVASRYLGGHIYEKSTKERDEGSLISEVTLKRDDMPHAIGEPASVIRYENGEVKSYYTLGMLMDEVATGDVSIENKAHKVSRDSEPAFALDLDDLAFSALKKR